MYHLNVNATCMYTIKVPVTLNILILEVFWPSSKAVGLPTCKYNYNVSNDKEYKNSLGLPGPISISTSTNDLLLL